MNRRGWIVVLCAAAVCILLSLGANALPKGPIREHVRQSVGVMRREGTYPRVLGLRDGVLDNWTDSIMLLTAAYDGEEPLLKRTFGNYRYEIPGTDPHYSLVKMAGEPQLGERVSYARYWHGYMPFVSGLLTVTDYSGIRAVNQVLQIGAAALIVFLLIKRGLKSLCLPFLAAWITLMPLTLQMSLQNSAVFYTSALAMIALLAGKERLDHIGLWAFFAVVGIVTNWADMLTYPVVSLIFPLCLLFAMEPAKGIKDGIRRLFFYSLCWAAGYGAMWILKWGLSTAVLGQDIFSDAMGAAQVRVSGGYGGQEWSRWDTIVKNLSFLNYAPYWGVMALSLAVSLIGGRKALRTEGIRWASAIPFLGAAVMPFVWYLVMNNHSYIHAVFTHRALSGAVFALLSMAAVMARGDWSAGSRRRQ